MPVQKSAADPVPTRNAPIPAFGAEVRALRKTRGMTLKNLSEATGVSVSYLSVVERDAAKPSAEILAAIAHALGIDISWFIMSPHGRGPLERDCVVRAAQRRNLNILYGTAPEEVGFKDELFSGSLGGPFYLSICTFAPGSDRTDKQMFAHEGEQHAVVISGAIELTLAEEVMVLRAGDSYSFDTRIEHHVRNALTDAESVLIWAVPAWSFQERWRAWVD